MNDDVGRTNKMIIFKDITFPINIDYLQLYT